MDTGNADADQARKTFRAEALRYRVLFTAAFNELHESVVKHVKSPGNYVGPHHDYPVRSSLDSGFPSFNEAGFYTEGSPRDYVGALRPRGLAGLLSGYVRPKQGFPKGAALASFLRSHDVGKRLRLKPLVDEETGFSDWAVDHLVADAVERYLHLYGLDDQVDPKRRSEVISRLIFGTTFRRLDLRLVVPIAITHFDVDHFPLSETTYAARLPRRLQLARARMSTHGSGVVKSVVGAATHAFVSKGWTIEVDNIDDVRSSLRRSSPNVLEAIDTFFGALRVATGISTGYAQFVWVPQGWALDYFCDLTPIYGSTLRQYPGAYDDYGWVRQGSSVTATQLVEVRRVYRALIKNKSEAVRLALKRLNSCLMRPDPADAILDGTIGLELLLGDDDHQSLSYKLRLRASALTILSAKSTPTAREIATKFKRLYKARSTIVHGRTKKPSKDASLPDETRHAAEREVASDLLRFVLEAVLAHPEYQDPIRIDEGLLMRGDDLPPAQPIAKRRKRK